MKQIISIFVFALLIGVANAQQTQQQTKQQLFPIYVATPEMRADPTSMKLLNDFNDETVELRKKYDALEKSMSDLDFAEEVYRMKREFDKQDSTMTASVNASMKKLIKQRELDALKAQGPNRNIQGGIQNDMNARYGTDSSVLTDDEYSAVQEGDLKMVHDTIFKSTVLLDSKRIARDSKHEDVVMEMDNSQIEREHSSQSTEKTYQSGQSVIRSSNSIEEAENSNVFAAITDSLVFENKLFQKAIKNESGRINLNRKAARKEERWKIRKMRIEGRDLRRQNRINRRISRRHDVMIRRQEKAERRQAALNAYYENHSNQNNGQWNGSQNQNCQQGGGITSTGVPVIASAGYGR